MPLLPLAQGGQGPDGGGSSPQDGPVTMYTAAAAQALHDSIAHESNPQHKLLLSKALQIVLQVQHDASSQQAAQQGPGAAMAGRLAPSGSGGPPQGPPMGGGY
jgi:hypothetical protein